MRTWVSEHKALLAALALAGVCSLAPLFETWYFIGADYRGVVQAYGDEILYQVHMHEIADGNPLYGNPYLLEHATDGPLVVFAGIWVAAVPVLLGMPLDAAVFFNFFVFSLLFVALGYWLLRELGTAKVIAALGALFAYVQYNGGVWRPSNQQQVNVVYLLFFIALARFLKRPEETARIVLLGVMTGLTFYVFSYLWQAAVVMLGLLALYALCMREGVLLRGAL